MADVGFVLESFPQLSETFVLDQMRALAVDGHDVHVIADRLNAYDESVFGDLSFIASSNLRWKAQPLISRLLGHLPWAISSRLKMICDVAFDFQLRRYQLLVAHFGLNGQRLARSRSLHRFSTPFICIFHGYDVGIPLAEGRLIEYRTLFDQAKLLLCVNQWFCEVLADAGASVDKLRVHRMGVDVTKIDYRERPREQLNILSVCRLVKKKGISVAIEAVSMLVKARPDVRVSYRIVGDGPLREELEQQARLLGVAEQVKFLGAMPHSLVQQELYAANVFLLPSVTAENGDVEGVPVSLMEAMASGATVVSSRHSGIPELIADKEGGLLADEFDAAGLAAALEALYERPEWATKLAFNGSLAVAETFNSAKLAPAFLNYIDSVLG